MSSFNIQMNVLFLFSVLVQKRVEFKTLKCIYKTNASSNWELEQFLSCRSLLTTQGQLWLVCDKRELFMQSVWNTDCILYF